MHMLSDSWVVNNKPTIVTLCGAFGTTGYPSWSPSTPCKTGLMSLSYQSGLTHLGCSDGLRVDSVKHVEPSFWPGFSAAAGVYLLGEVYQGDPLYVAPYQQHMEGVIDYPR